MSSHDKDPIKKQDTSRDSSKSSDSEIDEAEEDLGYLKIKESATKEEKKDDCDESKPPSREGTSTCKLDLLNEPVAGPSGLQNPRQKLLNEPVAGPSGLQNPRQKLLNEPVAGPSGLQKEKKVKAKGIEEDIGARMEEGELDWSDKIQHSAGGTHSSDVLKQPYRDVVGRFMDQQSSSSGLSLESSSSRRYDYATDSASTSADVSEIRSEIADSSREGSVYRDAPDYFIKEESPSYVSALESQQSSGTSDSNISEIQDFVLPPTPESRSVSISTNTGEQGNRAYIEQIRREAAARGSPISTSSGIRSTDQSELAHQQDWILAGARGLHGDGDDVPNQDLSDNVADGGEALSTSESMEDYPNLDQQMQDFDRLFGQEQPNIEDVAEGSEALPTSESIEDEPSLGRQMQDFDRLFGQEKPDVYKGGEPLPTSESIEDEPNLDWQMQDVDKLFGQEKPNIEDGEEMNVPEDERGASARRSQVEKAVQASGKGAESPCKRRRQTKCPSDSVISEMEAIENPRQKYKRNAGKKRKVASNQSHPALQSSSESPEPKSSSSQELHRKESPDIESSSGAQEVSMTRRSERMLRKQEHAMSSMERVKGEVRTSPSTERGPGLMETEDPTPETIPEKGGEGAAETSEAKPSTESTDQAYRSETDGTLKEPEESFEDLGFEGSARKSKLEPKLSNTPPSDEKPNSSVSKAATSRPKKRARSEKMHGKKLGSRHDSGGNVPKSVGLGSIEQGESKSSPDVSDYTPSDDEKEIQS